MITGAGFFCIYFDIKSFPQQKLISLLRKTKIDDVTPTPTFAGVKLSPRKWEAGGQGEKLDFRPFGFAQGRLSAGMTNMDTYW
jgi:hypothetical protein